jgi:hypothetical protein
MADHSQQTQADEYAEIAAACRGAPTWITPEAVRDTLQVFRPYYKEGLTVSDALEILINTGNLFDWLKKQNDKGNSVKMEK